jgi:hypothetical protein
LTDRQPVDATPQWISANEVQRAGRNPAEVIRLSGMAGHGSDWVAPSWRAPPSQEALAAYLAAPQIDIERSELVDWPTREIGRRTPALVRLPVLFASTVAKMPLADSGRVGAAEGASPSVPMVVDAPSSKTQMHQRILETVAGLWPNGSLPAKARDRDRMIGEAFAKRGETKPHPRTIQRALRS